MSNVSTRFHVLQELAGAEPLVSVRMVSAAHYAIGADVVEMLAREDVGRSIKAVIEAGIARLPYAPILIEYSAAGSSARRFVLLDEAEAGFSAECATLFRDRMADVSPSKVKVALTGEHGLSVGRHSDLNEAHAVAFAAAIALLMLNVKGIDKELVESTKLNRARVKHGRIPIPSHTLVRIGTIYDRSGHAVSGGMSRHLPVHLRAGHSRMQACGPNHADRKAIYIPPVLVNYREDGVMPAAPKRLVKA
ncbi:hypothetical protein JYU29_05775 [Tianweitania sp. BSSL-BM11]|uniref:Uncharacterized protein n=1 Tax=Tianweitania aestuarii TaxID=2814886 RepID=A0ABS5RT18_9HYPH|nr:hypothetical protein [Tianweitania aestuarii]MBS9720195.1 hypothetical protein [Tianweitania aestuarii]